MCKFWRTDKHIRSKCLLYSVVLYKIISLYDQSLNKNLRIGFMMYICLLICVKDPIFLIVEQDQDQYLKKKIFTSLITMAGALLNRSKWGRYCSKHWRSHRLANRRSAIQSWLQPALFRIVQIFIL